MSESRRGAYTGDARKLVVAIDIGTTYTAASFSLLEPGDVPQIHQIQSWPEQVTSDAKVPSVVLYDKLGTARAFGAATEDDGVKDQATDEKWIKAEWWKLRLRPDHLPPIRDLKLAALPPATTCDGIFADFLGYVKEQLETYVKAKYGDGDKIWNACLPSLELVLTTPNGWELQQQQRMRAAAQKSELVIGDDSAERVRFVTEAEAALLYSIESGCIGEWLKLNNELIVCDCGGGTIDITNYEITGLGPLRLEETTTSACYLAGGVFVTEACKKFLKSHLKGTEWASDYSVDQAASKFENNAKRKFSGTDTTSWIELGGSKTIPGKDIKRGKLRLPAEKVASFFADSLEAVKQGLSEAYRKSGNKAKVILVGGFASSPYVFGELQDWGRTLGMSLSRPDGLASKPVPEGALLWYLDAADLTTTAVMPRVTARINKVHYGASSLLPWIPFIPEMVGRPRIFGPAGDLMTPGGWCPIVAKGEKIENGREYTESYTAMKLDLGDVSYPFTCPIYIYRGEEPPLFLTRPESPMDRERLCAGFEELCTIHADLTVPMKAAPVQIGVFNEGYKEVKFTVCLTFGDTELHARVRWEDNDEIKYGKATVVSRAHAE